MTEEIIFVDEVKTDELASRLDANDGIVFGPLRQQRRETVYSNGGSRYQLHAPINESNIIRYNRMQ